MAHEGGSAPERNNNGQGPPYNLKDDPPMHPTTPAPPPQPPSTPPLPPHQQHQQQQQQQQPSPPPLQPPQQQFPAVAQPYNVGYPPPPWQYGGPGYPPAQPVPQYVNGFPVYGHQPPMVPPPYHARPPYAVTKRTRVCCALVSALALMFAVTVLIIFLVYQPRVPRLAVQDITVYALNISSLSSPSSVRYNFSVTVQAYNPNKRLRVHYESLYVGASLNNVDIAETRRSSSFVQSPLNTSLSQIQFQSDQQSISSGSAGNLQKAIDSGTLRFVVVVAARARVLLGGLRSLSFVSESDCDVYTKSPTPQQPGKIVRIDC